MLINYPICVIYAENGENVQYVYAPDLKVKFLAGKNLTGWPLTAVKAAACERITAYINQLEAAGAKVASPKPLELYKVQFSAENRLWLDVSLEIKHRRGLFEVGVPAAGLFFSFVLSGLLAFNILCSADLTVNSRYRPTAIVLGLLSALSSTMTVLLIYYISGTFGATASIGRQMDDSFRRELSRAALLPLVRPGLEALDRDVSVAEETRWLEGKGKAPAAMSSATASTVQTTSASPLAPDTDLQLLAQADKQPLARGEQLHRVGVSTGVALAMLVDTALGAMLVYQGTYHVGTAAFEGQLSPTLVTTIAALTAGFIFIEGMTIATGAVSSTVAEVDANRIQAQLEELRETQAVTTSGSPSQIGLFAPAPAQSRASREHLTAENEANVLQLG